MEKGSGKDLGWFFYNWFYTPGYIDLALTKVEKKGKGYILTIKNVGGFVVPFDVIATYSDGTTEQFHQTPAVWERDQKDITVSIKPGREVKTLTLDGGIFMDANRKDNTWAGN
jgi:hypothetical protein